MAALLPLPLKVAGNLYWAVTDCCHRRQKRGPSSHSALESARGMSFLAFNAAGANGP